MNMYHGDEMYGSDRDHPAYIEAVMTSEIGIPNCDASSRVMT